MEFYENVLPDNLCEDIYNLAYTVATTPGGVKIAKQDGSEEEALQCWMNYGWETSLIEDSTPVFCIKLPKIFINKIQNEMEKLGVFDNKKYLSFEENNWLGCMVYVWTHNSYISLHHDSERRTATIYLNKHWDYKDGGHFNWYDKKTDEWKMSIPKYNTMIVNNGGIPHATTPVKAKDKFRISIQLFFIPKNN